MTASYSSSSAAAAASSYAGQTGGEPSQQDHRAGGGGRDSAAATCAAALKSRCSKWPDALPPPAVAAAADVGEELSSCPCILSAVCDASGIHWALHEPMARTVFRPYIYWKTSAPAGQNQEQDTAPLPEEFFTRYFPEKAIKAILGGGGNPDVTIADVSNSNSNNALLVQKLFPYWSVQGIPVMFIYVISTNDATFGILQHLTSRLPVRLILLQETDFFDIHHHPSDMRVDRLAALAAAQCIYGGPALVIHGESKKISFSATAIDEETTTSSATATSTQEVSSSSSSDHYDALCHSIRVRGEGIGPGFAAKFFALQSSSGGSLPPVNFEEFQQYLSKLKMQQQQPAAAAAFPPRMLDAHSTKEEIMGNVVQETTSHLRSVVATWANDALASPTFQRRKRQADAKAARGVVLENKATCNRLLYVCITGKEGPLLRDLLSSPSASNDQKGISFLHPDTVLPELPCQVNFVCDESLVHHGISHLLLMHHERRREQQRLYVGASTSDDNLRTMFLGQRLAQRKQVLRGLFIMRGTVVSVQKRQLPVASCNNNNIKSHGLDDGIIYHIMYDDGQKDEMNGEELYDALILYHAEGEKKKRRPAAEALEKLRNAKRAAAKEVAKLLEQVDAAVVVRMKKLGAERQTVTAAAAAAQDKGLSTSNTSSGTCKRVDADIQATSDAQAMESSKKSTATATDNNTTLPKPVATNESASTADGSIQPQAAKKGSRFGADKPTTNGVQAPESSKNAVVVAAATATKSTTVPKSSAEAKEAAATQKPQTTTTKATTSLTMPEATAAVASPTSAAAKKKAPAASSKKQQVASAAKPKTPKSASTVKTAAAAAKTSKSASTVKTASASTAATKTPKSASTVKTTKRPNPSAAQEPESVKKPRKASPPQNKSAAPAPPPARQQRQLPTASAAPAPPIMPPTRKSLKDKPKSYTKQRFAKYFDDGELYFGKVSYYNSDRKLWRIVYDDGDREDYEVTDMIKFGKEYERNKHKDHEDPNR